MSEYPEDIVRTAANLARDIMGEYAEDGTRAVIAEAIMAERERCAAAGYWVCAETRHVTLGDKVRVAIKKGDVAK